jgi:ribosome biogenesis protein NSA1
MAKFTCIDSEFDRIIEQPSFISQVRLYDIRAQRRPIVNLNVGEKKLTAMTLTHRDKVVLVGNAHGEVMQVDVRSGKGVVCTYKGIGGSVR